MKKLLILSGKGGTGKTTTAAAFIRFAAPAAFADCDVDAPNLHIVTSLGAEPQRTKYYGSEKAFIDPEKCIGCGLCAEKCRFGAIRERDGVYYADEFACEGCGVCSYVCPAEAVSLREDEAGDLTLYGGSPVFSTAQLKMGRGNSGKLVSEVKNNMKKAAPPDGELAIIDGPPGIGCPVIASVSGVNMVLAVTEPTVSGMSDLKRILKTVSNFHTKLAVCVNKYDACPEKAMEIKDFCRENGIAFAGFVPYDKTASAAINSGRSVADTDCPARTALKAVFDRTMEILYED